MSDTKISISIQTQVIDTGLETLNLQNKNAGHAGALVFFVGMVRDFIENQQDLEKKLANNASAVQTLFLDYYPSMCENEIRKICTQAEQRWNPLEINVIHRVGDINIGEPIVFIGVVCKHRTAAFQAAEFIIDALKTSAPFWKKETLADGKSYWVQQNQKDKIKAASWES